MVIGNDHPHTHNGKYATYVEVYGPQGPIFRYKGPAFFLASKAATCLWFGVVIGIDYPHTHIGPSIHNVNMLTACLLDSTPEVLGRASAGIDVLESSSSSSAL